MSSTPASRFVAFLRTGAPESPLTPCHLKKWMRKRGTQVSKLRRARKFAAIALATLAIVLAVNAPSQARGGGHGFGGGHSFGGGHPGGGDGHHGFDGHHDFVHRPFVFGFGGVYPYYPYYPYDPYYYPPAYEAPAYWYYCPSYGAYYPNVVSCPEAWVPVPAS
jgi:hypothetical protein